jgi:hypothetical protein
MNFLKNIFKNILSKEPHKLLGRWNISYSTKIIDKNIDLSNEDHCGTCSNIKIYTKKNKNNRKE